MRVITLLGRYLICYTVFSRARAVPDAREETLPSMSALTTFALNLAIRVIGWFFSLFSESAGRWWTRKQIAPASGRALSILVAKISADNSANSNHHSIREAIENAMKDSVSVIGWPYELPLGDGLDALAHEKSESLARRWLKSKKCDLLISGRMKSDNVVSLRFTTLNPEQPSITDRVQGAQTYSLPTETMEFPADFISHLGAAVAASALANIREHHKDALAPAIRNVSAQLVEIMNRLATVPDVQIRARLVGCYASARGVLFDCTGNEDDLTAAVDASKQALSLLNQNEHPLEWAKQKSQHGAAIARLGGYRRDRVILELGATEMRDSLNDLSGELISWAKANLNLALLHYQLFRITGSTDKLHSALEVYDHILTDELRERDPFIWATAQNYYGTALAAMSERQTNDSLLNQAMDAFTYALEVWTSEFPMQRAMTLTNLSGALVSLGLRQNTLDWHRIAIERLREADGFISQEHAPRLWFTIRLNIGQALSLLGQEDAARCKEAVAVLRDLRRTVPMSDREHSLKVSFNLARALTFAGKTGENISLLTEGRAIWQELLADPSELDSDVLNELGLTHRYMGLITDDIDDFLKSRTIFERLSENSSAETSPLTFIRIKFNLAAALREIGIRNNSLTTLRESVSAISTALEITSKDTSPVTWAGLQASLAATLFEIAKREEGHASLHSAEDAIANALTVFGPQHSGPSPREARLLADEIELFGNEQVTE
jgi:tetratricopeptide (TPR) repeat protein